MKQHYYEKLLNIKTGIYQKESDDAQHYYPYEPTAYEALEALLESYAFKKDDCMVDFGCGKGRLSFFIHYFSRIHVKGIEMDKALYEAATANKNNYLRKMNKHHARIAFYCCLAQKYPIDASDNRFYFFNPFSLPIFMKVINNILRSVEIANRDVELILYYASDDYIYYLENHTIFERKEEIILPKWYKEDPSERFLIYQLPALSD